MLYSTIFNRAALPDFTQDLKPRMGIERMSTQSIYALQSEFGPNGEQVFAAQNDLFGQIRFVGGWSNINGSTNGSYAATNSVSDYCEITFYGTGLNILTNTDFGTNTWSYSVDGGGSSTFLSASASNTVLNARNYAKQQIVNVVAGLTLGVHTVKITQASVATLGIFGFEILNESSSVKVPTGIAYVNGQKLVSSTLSAFSYSAPVTGTKGGRVLVYLSSAGVISQAFTAVNASQANLTSADHTNEEVARIYYPREFGAGRSDDFSGNYSAGSNLAFTLDDGTTTLRCVDTPLVLVVQFKPSGLDIMIPSAPTATNKLKSGDHVTESNCVSNPLLPTPQLMPFMLTSTIPLSPTATYVDTPSVAIPLRLVVVPLPNTVQSIPFGLDTIVPLSPTATYSKLPQTTLLRLPNTLCCLTVHGRSCTHLIPMPNCRGANGING